MKINFNGTIGLLALIVIGTQGAKANSQTYNIKPGVYYSLTPAAVKALNIDLYKLRTLVPIQASEELAFQVREDGELDLSIYADGVFAQIRADIVESL